MMETILVNAPEPVLRSSFTNHSNTLTRRLISGVTCAPGRPVQVPSIGSKRRRSL